MIGFDHFTLDAFEDEKKNAEELARFYKAVDDMAERHHRELNEAFRVLRRQLAQRFRRMREKAQRGEL